jgi:hypothetical protein
LLGIGFALEVERVTLKICGDVVDEAHRDRRIAELRVLQFNDPRGLIEQYCRIMGGHAGTQMPHGISFSKMIDTIVDHETTTQSAIDTTH